MTFLISQMLSVLKMVYFLTLYFVLFISFRVVVAILSIMRILIIPCKEGLNLLFHFASRIVYKFQGGKSNSFYYGDTDKHLSTDKKVRSKEQVGIDMV